MEKEFLSATMSYIEEMRRMDETIRLERQKGDHAPTSLEMTGLVLTSCFLIFLFYA